MRKEIPRADIKDRERERESFARNYVGVCITLLIIESKLHPVDCWIGRLIEWYFDCNWRRGFMPQTNNISEWLRERVRSDGSEAHYRLQKPFVTRLLHKLYAFHFIWPREWEVQERHSLTRSLNFQLSYKRVSIFFFNPPIDQINELNNFSPFHEQVAV